MLAGDKFIPENHLRQPRFAYSACGLFTKNKKRIQKFTETGDSRCIYQNELDKSSFQHNIAYRDFMDLPGRTDSHKILCDKAFGIAKTPKHDGYQCGFASMVYKFFDRNSATHIATGINSDAVPRNQHLADDLLNPINRTFKKRNIYSSFKEKRQHLGCRSSRYAVDK